MTKMKFKIFKHDSQVWGQRCLDGTTVTFNDQRSQELYRSSRPPAGLKPEINFLKDPNNQSRLISFTTCCCYFHQDWHQDEVEVWLSDDLVGGSGVGILGVTVRGIGTRGGNMWGEGKGLNPLWQNAKKRIRGFLDTSSTRISVFTKIASSQQGVAWERGQVLEAVLGPVKGFGLLAPTVQDWEECKSAPIIWWQCSSSSRSFLCNHGKMSHWPCMSGKEIIIYLTWYTEYINV